jgi:hypothetical protein
MEGIWIILCNYGKKKKGKKAICIEMKEEEIKSSWVLI